MKVSLREIHDSAPFLGELCSGQPLPLDLSIPMSQALVISEQQVKIINKGLLDMAAVLGFIPASGPNDPAKLLKANKDGNLEVPDPVMSEFNEKAEAYLSTHFINIPVRQITKAELEVAKVRITPLALARLGWLFDLFSKDAQATNGSKPKPTDKKKGAS